MTALRALLLLLLLAPAVPGVRATTDLPAAAAVGVPLEAEAARVDGLGGRVVDAILTAFHERGSGNTPTHYAIALLITLVAYVLRRVVTTLVFSFCRRLAARTETTLDDRLLPALEGPLKTLIVVTGVVLALQVLRLSPAADGLLRYGSTMAFSFVIFWAVLSACNAVLDHLGQVARDRHLGLAPFMPWIKKTLLAVVFIFGVLMIAQGLGADVKAALGALGIGGLAFALAAQDTIANLFGSVVVAVDQPFKVGETIRVGGNVGTVEDIGLRSTKLRLLDRSLMVIPNKTVAGEVITNLSRFNGRRVEQIIGLTYGTTAEQMAGIVADLRRLIEARPEVNAADTHVYFRDYGPSSLDLWIVYSLREPDFARGMQARQEINLAILRAVEARGLAFAFPTQTVHVASLPPRA